MLTDLRFPNSTVILIILKYMFDPRSPSGVLVVCNGSVQLQFQCINIMTHILSYYYYYQFRIVNLMDLQRLNNGLYEYI